MDSEVTKTLSKIERQCLAALLDKKPRSFEQIARDAGISVDSVRRGASWLRDKGLADWKEKTASAYTLTRAGKEAQKKGFPERRFMEAVQKAGGRAVLSDLQKKLDMGPEFNFALGIAKKNAWVSVQKEAKGVVVEATGLEKDFLSQKTEAERAIGDLGEADPAALKELLARRMVEKSERTERIVTVTESGVRAAASAKGKKDEINTLDADMVRSGAWKNRSFRAYNIQDPVPPVFAGKRQPYLAFLEQVKAKLVEMGFAEMAHPLVTQEFYNFDVLFQPQNHPARTWTDSYQLKNPASGDLPDPKVVARVKAAHEHGGKCGSKGWGYTWDPAIAARLMPAAHGTAHSARTLVGGSRVPGKYFAIARCYRPDVIDATHGAEFNQMEGFISDASFTFRHLLGMLKGFAAEVAGATKVRFNPSYFPFTEPSAELIAKHPELGWIELGGSGLFRPEMMEAMGVSAPTLAWGLGIDRLAMFALDIKDIRHLFSDDLNWLREQPLVR